jgi:hypothetical protein
MTPLGKSLSFLLKYPAEMEQLYGKGEDADLEGLEDPEVVRKMARAVGAQAYEEAAQLLEECGKKVEDHFTALGIAKMDRRIRRSSILRDWLWQARVVLTSASDAWFWAGVSLRSQKRLLVPWISGRGSRTWEEMVVTSLGRRAHSGSRGGLVTEAGTVALASILVFGENQPGSDVDRDALVAKAVAAFTAIGADDVIEIARQPGRAEESDEGNEPQVDRH